MTNAAEIGTVILTAIFASIFQSIVQIVLIIDIRFIPRFTNYR